MKKRTYSTLNRGSTFGQTIGENNEIHQHFYGTGPRLTRPTTPADIEAAQRKLAQLPLDVIPEVAPIPPGSRILFSHNPHFVGRQDNLQTLATALKG